MTGIFIYPTISFTIRIAYFDNNFLYSYKDEAFFYTFFIASASITDKILVEERILVFKFSELIGRTILSILEFKAHLISEK